MIPFALLLRLLFGGPRPTPPAVPTPTPTPTPPAADPDPNTITYRLWQAHDAERRRAGLPAFRHDARLTGVSRRFAAEIAARHVLTHTRLSMTPFSVEIENAVGRVAFVECSENAAEGQRSPEEAVADWMTSPGHRANILSREYDTFGGGMARAADGTAYWVCDFARLGG